MLDAEAAGKALETVPSNPVCGQSLQHSVSAIGLQRVNAQIERRRAIEGRWPTLRSQHGHRFHRRTARRCAQKPVRQVADGTTAVLDARRLGPDHQPFRIVLGEHRGAGFAQVPAAMTEQCRQQQVPRMIVRTAPDRLRRRLSAARFFGDEARDQRARARDARGSSARARRRPGIPKASRAPRAAWAWSKRAGVKRILFGIRISATTSSP